MSTKTTHLTIQRWGNSLAVRIPASIAKYAHLEVNTPVEVALEEVGIAIKPLGQRKLTLDERLAKFDLKKHGGEVMATDRVGKEKF